MILFCKDMAIMLGIVAFMCYLLVLGSTAQAAGLGKCFGLNAPVGCPDKFEERDRRQEAREARNYRRQAEQRERQRASDQYLESLYQDRAVDYDDYGY